MLQHLDRETKKNNLETKKNTAKLVRIVSDDYLANDAFVIKDTHYLISFTLSPK